VTDDLRAGIEALIAEPLLIRFDDGRTGTMWSEPVVRVSDLDVLLAAHPVQDEEAGECPFDRTGETRDEWGIQWDGDPKMGGGFHVQGLGATWPTEAEARTVADRVLNRKPSLRIVYRVASSWTTVSDRPGVTP